MFAEGVLERALADGVLVDWTALERPAGAGRFGSVHAIPGTFHTDKEMHSMSVTCDFFCLR